MKPGKTGIPRILDATGYSMKGIRAAWTNEAAFRQESIGGLVMLVLSFFIAADPLQWLLLVLPLLVLVIVELINSALESVVDRIGPEKHELSGRTKDMGSAAVFFSLVMVTISWAAVIWHNFF
jgi:diacylglycerol kinase (ATP)